MSLNWPFSCLISSKCLFSCTKALISSHPRSKNPDQFFYWVPTVNPITRLACNCCWGARGAPARGFRLSVFSALSAVSGGPNNLGATSVSNLESAQTQRCPGRSQTENVLEVLSLKTDTPQTAHWDLRGSVQVECQSARPPPPQTDYQRWNGIK